MTNYRPSAAGQVVAFRTNTNSGQRWPQSPETVHKQYVRVTDVFRFKHAHVSGTQSPEAKLGIVSRRQAVESVHIPEYDMTATVAFWPAPSLS